MFIGPLIALAVIAVLAVTAVCSGHIPGLDRLTGAAPLLADDTTAPAWLPCHTTTCGHMTTPHDHTPAGLVCRSCTHTVTEVPR
ncbi:MAG: hypothetical protein HOW97_34030 [Catenulispora sp.]|nr:hypothetical protein [Catenulispora sp.]